MVNFGENLKRIREERGMSQDELAKAVGFKDRSAVTRIEKGYNGARYDTIIKLCAVLGVSPIAFFESSDKLELSDNEKDIIHWYRTNPNFKAGVDSLVVALNIEKKSEDNGTSSKRA